MSSPVATVVVVSWQGAHLLGPCLDALAEQTLPASRFRVVVVDNASTDGTADLLAGRAGLDEVLRPPRNLGFAGGATLALRRTRTPHAVVLNNDARPEPDWLERLLDGFTMGVAAVTSKVLLEPRYIVANVPAAGADDIAHVTLDGRDITRTVIGSREDAGLSLLVPSPDGTTGSLIVRFTDDRGELTMHIAADQPRLDVINSTGGVLTATGHGADRGYLEVDHGQYDHATDVFAVCGAAAAFRTDVGHALGWFDPWLFAYYEDLDLSWRIRRAGWSVRYAPRARVRHLHAQTSALNSPFFHFHNRRNRLAVLVRNASLREVAHVAGAVMMPRASATAAFLGASTDRPVAPGERLLPLASFLARSPRLIAGRRRSPVSGLPKPPA